VIFTLTCAKDAQKRVLKDCRNLKMCGCFFFIEKGERKFMKGSLAMENIDQFNTAYIASSWYNATWWDFFVFFMSVPE